MFKIHPLRKEGCFFFPPYLGVVGLLKTTIFWWMWEAEEAKRKKKDMTKATDVLVTRVLGNFSKRGFFATTHAYIVILYIHTHVLDTVCASVLMCITKCIDHFICQFHLRAHCFPKSMGIKWCHHVLPWRLASPCPGGGRKENSGEEGSRREGKGDEIDGTQIRYCLSDIPSLKLTANLPLKITDWFRWHFLLRCPILQVRTVSFRECIWCVESRESCLKTLKKSIGWRVACIASFRKVEYFLNPGIRNVFMNFPLSSHVGFLDLGSGNFKLQVWVLIVL